MRRVFADTLYWVGVLDSRDPWHPATVQAEKALGKHRTITTDAVFVEVLNTFCKAGPTMRRRAITFVRELMARRSTEVVAQDRAQLLAAMTFYHSRPDKEYSLTDCISMLTMRDRRLTEVLTNDHHFEQEGFDILLPER